MNLASKHSFFIIAFTIIFGSCQNKTVSLQEDLIESIEKRIDYGLNGAIAIGIIDQSGIHYYNFGSKDTSGIEVDEHTIFEIGSITKTFTATLLADLEIKEKLSVNDPVNNILSDSIQLSILGNKQITLGHLSDHTSGLPRMPSNINPSNPNNPFADYSTTQLYEFISSYTPNREVGEYEYSNLAVGLLGHCLSLKEGKTYENLVSEVITRPLGMNETKINLDDQMITNLVKGRDEFGRITENWDFLTLEGAGGMKSSSSDMIKYVSAQLGLNESSLKEAMEKTHQKRHENYPIREGSDPIAMGLGWIITMTPNGDIHWHTGGTGGYRTYLGFDKQKKKGVVVLGTGYDSSDIGRYLLSADTLNEIKRSLSTELARKIDLQGIESAQNYFEDSVLNNLEEFSYGSYPLNRLANNYLDEDRSDASMVIFQINIKLFPNSWNVYDAYGEALRNTGQLDESLQNFKKSVELNPQNQNALKAIVDLEERLEMIN